MDALAFAQPLLARRELLRAGALVVGFSLAGLPAARAQAAATARRSLALTEVDSFLALRRDGSVVIYSGKVDLGTGHRIAMRQMVGEELVAAGASHRTGRRRQRPHAEPGPDRGQHAA